MYSIVVSSNGRNMNNIISKRNKAIGTEKQILNTRSSGPYGPFLLAPAEGFGAFVPSPSCQEGEPGHPVEPGSSGQKPAKSAFLKSIFWHLIFENIFEVKN